MPGGELPISMFTPKTPHFFKIILDGTLRDRKLGIPRKFVRKYGNGLSSSSVLLMVPSGDTWHVELTKSDNGDVWLENGWQEFAEHYSLQYGHFLVFKFEGDCKFLVLIFDMSASEIEYPYKILKIEDKKNDEEQCQEPDREEAAETWYESPQHKETRKKSRSSPCFRPLKTLRTTSKDKNKRSWEDVSISEGDLQNNVPRAGHAFGANEYDKALQRASAFTSENPFFLVTMQPSYINPGRKMCIPTNFTTTFLKGNLGDVTLCNSEGKTWSAQYWRYISVKKYTKAILYNGWREFMQDNKLEAGDICVFELINQKEIMLKVAIYRVRQATSCSSPLGGINSSANGGNVRLSTHRSTQSNHLGLMRPMTSHEKAMAILKASNFKSDNPFFKVVMQPRYLTIRCSLSVPYKFVKKYLDEKKEQVILQVPDGRTWVVKFSVKVFKSGQHKAEFCHCWRAFALENNLEVGDVCVFELINRHETSFKVSIFSAEVAANSSLSPQADDTRTSQVASTNCLIPKREADDDFGNCCAGNSSPAAQFAALGYQATEEEIKPITTTRRTGPLTQRTKRKQPLRAGEKLKALQRASGFKSQNPFFIVTMQPSYVSKGHRLAIPSEFSRKYLTKGVGDIILCIPNGKTWWSKYNRPANDANSRASFIDGWKAFAEDNSLEVGDVCVFEMLKSKGHEFSFNVAIYRAEEDESSFVKKLSSFSFNKSS